MSAFSKMGLVLILLIMAGQNSGNVDNIAHIGGFVTGMICGIVSYLLVNRKNIEISNCYIKIKQIKLWKELHTHFK